MNDSFQGYVNHAVGLTRPEYYQQQLQNIQRSPKYKDAAGAWQPVPFPGYTIIAPPGSDDPINQAFYQALRAAQQQLAEVLPDRFFIALPESSLHLTLADLLWADAFLAAQALPDFDANIQREIAGVFERDRSQPDESKKPGPLRFQALGYMVMPRALSICLVPETEATFRRLMNLRRSIYQTEALLGLGVEQHYNMTLHITLGYFGEIPADLDIQALGDRLLQLNPSAIVPLPEFLVERAELRRFDNMETYRREPDWPVLAF